MVVPDQLLLGIFKEIKPWFMTNVFLLWVKLLIGQLFSFFDCMSDKQRKEALYWRVGVASWIAVRNAAATAKSFFFLLLFSLPLVFVGSEGQSHLKQILDRGRVTEIRKEK